MKDQLKVLYENMGEDYIYTSMKYVLKAGNMDDLDDLSEILSSINTEMGGEVMSIAERLFTQGREEGLSQGLSQGVQKSAKNFLAEGVDPQVVSRATGLTLEVIKQLQESEEIAD